MMDGLQNLNAVDWYFVIASLIVCVAALVKVRASSQVLKKRMEYLMAAIAVALLAVMLIQNHVMRRPFPPCGTRASSAHGMQSRVSLTTRARRATHGMNSAITSLRKR